MHPLMPFVSEELWADYVGAANGANGHVRRAAMALGQT